ncbi:MAG: cation transporter, partial [Armatimonadetes bacterium]|nr:cation transporter [Armatimonadota bacterium]
MPRKELIMKYHDKIKIARLSIISNLSLIILKIFVGVITKSVSILSEAIHSGNDLAAAIIAFLAVKRADQPADKDHPFGHGKFENISGTIEGILIIVSALWIIFEAIKKFFHPGEIIKIDLGIAVMLISAIVNIFVAKILFKAAGTTDSAALLADAEHLRTDVFTALGVFLALILIKITRFNILDPIVAIIVAIIIIKIGYKVVNLSFNPLMDAGVESETVQCIVDIIKSCDKRILGFHQLRIRRS